MSRKFFLSLIFPLFIFFNFSIRSAKVIFGDTNSGSDKSFNFSIGAHAFYKFGFDQFTMFVAANEEKEKNNFAVARVDRDSTKFQALTPQKIKLNNVDNLNNPLNGAKISFLQVLSGFPAVVKYNDNKIYLITGSDKNLSLLSSPEITDANGEKTAKIIRMNVANSSTLLDSNIFAVVLNKDGDPLGQDGSGIAVVKLKNKSVTQLINGKEIVRELQELALIDATKEKVTTKKSPDPKLKGEKLKEYQLAMAAAEILKKRAAASEVIKAVPFNGRIDAIKINSNALISSNVIDMHWDGILNRLYIALQVESGIEANSGARAIVMAYFLNGKLILSPIAPNQVFLGSNNKIVGTGNPDQFVSIYKVKTMITSTLLNYLVVAGGNGPLNAVSNNVYALPLTTQTNPRRNAEIEALQGTLAKFDQMPQDVFMNEFFINRIFPQPAQSASDALTSNDIAAKVGGGPLPLTLGQLITELFIIGDSVFATIGNDYDGTTVPGIFYSQAIFDERGVIVNWTKWQKIAGTDNQVFGADVDFMNSQFWFMVGSSANSIDTVKMSTWSKGESNSLTGDGILGGNAKNKEVGLINILGKIFPIEIGGIQGFFDFSKNTSGFNNFSMMIATGLKKIVLIESGKIQSGFYKPITGDFASGKIISNNGIFSNITPSTKIVAISGGVLNEINSIVSSEIATDLINNEHWIVVAGVGGIAVLMDANGNGWNGDVGSLSDIPSGLEFKKIGNYSSVIKIKSDGKYLYVLTNKKLDRIELSSNNFKTGNLKITTLADLKNLKLPDFAALTDFIVSNKFALLGTTKGLFRVGNGKDITLASDTKDVNWTFVDVANSLGAVSHFFVLSQTNQELDFAFNGQVYVINSFIGFHQTRVNRFIVNLNGSIDNSTIKPLPDIIIKNSLTNFYDFGSFRNNYSNNISLNFNSASQDANINTFLNLIPGVRSGSKFVTTFNFGIPISLIKNDTQIGPLVMDSATGSMLVTGNFGLQVNE